MTDDLPMTEDQIEVRKFDQEMLAALTRLGFEIEEGGQSAFAECSVLIGDGDFKIQIVRHCIEVSLYSVTREQLLSAARAMKNEDAAV